MIEKKEGFFSSLFKGKRNEDTEKDKLVFQNMLDKKDRIISQLHEKLHFEEERRKKAEVFSKQADIIQKNLESRDKKNKELLTTLENLKVSEGKLKVIVDTLENKLEDTSREKNDALAKYDELLKEFNKTAIEVSELKETHKSLKEEIGSLNALKEKGEQMQIVGDVFLSRDEVEEMHEEVTSLQRICGEYREQLDHNKEQISLKESAIIDLKERLKASLAIDRNEVHYRLPIDILFSSSKYERILTDLYAKDIFFTDQLSHEILSEAAAGDKNIQAAQKVFRDFSEGRYSWDIKTFISKGPKLSKIFTRQRKLLGYFNDNYMEFLIDLENFDFNILSESGFSSSQIKGFEEKLSEYNNFRIRV